MYNKEKILAVLHDIVTTSKSIKPYLVVAQPRRDLQETPAQNFDGYDGLHIDMHGYSHGFVNIGGEKVDVARNYLIEQALTSGAKYLLFAGEDTVIPYSGFLKLHEVAEQNPDSMVVGVYYIKLSSPMIMLRENDHIRIANVDPGQVFEAWMTGLDCALIPISLLQKLKDNDPEIPFCCIANNVDGIPFIGEDNFFVHRWHQMGWKILVNTDVQCLHMDLASGKYTAHPSVKLRDYLTQIPVTEPLTFKDKEYIDKRWYNRLPKGSGSQTPKLIFDMIEKGQPIKLNLGSGGNQNDENVQGYISVDSCEKVGADIVMDVNDLALPENSVTEIFASHLFEHLNPHLVKNTLRNWLKCLKPDGLLVMEMPDIEALCSMLLESKDETTREMATLCIYGALNTTKVGVSSDITSPHLWGYCPSTIKPLLEEIGFVDIVTMGEKIPHPGKNFRVEAKKPKELE